MATPSHDEAIRDFINLVSRTRELTPDLPRSVFPVMTPNDVERVSLGEAMMIPILCSLMSTVTELKTQVSTLQSALTALDAHTRSLPSAATIQEVVSESATVPLSASVLDLSHRVAGIPTAQTHAGPSFPNRPPNVTAQVAQPQPPRPPRLNKQNSAQAPPSMDSDIPRLDPSSKIFYGNLRAYATKFPNSWEAEAFTAGKYPPSRYSHRATKTSLFPLLLLTNTLQWDRTRRQLPAGRAQAGKEKESLPPVTPTKSRP